MLIFRFHLRSGDRCGIRHTKSCSACLTIEGSFAQFWPKTSIIASHDEREYRSVAKRTQHLRHLSGLCAVWQFGDDVEPFAAAKTHMDARLTNPVRPANDA